MDSNFSGFIIGNTENNIPIVAHKFKNSGPNVLIIGGVHGDEYEGIALATGLICKLANINANITLIPVLNYDGMLMKTRVNANGVDLNRNLPTKDWSPKIAKPRYNPGKSANNQSETKALTKLIDKEKPSIIVSLHSYDPMININGDCLGFAKKLQKYTGYEIKDYIGYPTPGNLGTYGTERGIPVITYEIQRDLEVEKIIKVHLPALLNTLKEIYGSNE